jgi:hypothetical protein
MKNTPAIVALCCFFAGCSQTATPITTLKITAAPDPANNDDCKLTLVSFRPPVKSEIIVEFAGGRGTILFDPKNANSDQDSNVRFSANRKKTEDNANSIVETIIRPETPNGGRAGGSIVEEFQVDKPLDDILMVTIQDGEYPLGKQIEIGTYKGNAVHLTVRAVPN